MSLHTYVLSHMLQVYTLQYTVKNLPLSQLLGSQTFPNSPIAYVHICVQVNYTNSCANESHKLEQSHEIRHPGLSTKNIFGSKQIE